MLASRERGVLHQEDSGILGVSGGRGKSLIKKQELARGEVSLTSMPQSQEAIRVDAEVKVGLGRDFTGAQGLMLSSLVQARDRRVSEGVWKGEAESRHFWP